MKPPPTLPDAALADMENEAIRAWRELFSVTAQPIREAVAHVVREGADTLTEDFYSRMQNHARAASLLEQERVQRRLRASLRQWMIDLFGTLEVEHILPSIRRQIEVGAVHARIRLPIDLIPSGIRLLKRGIRRRIDFTPLDASDRLIAQIYVSDLLHLADGLMNLAYFRDTQEVVRNDEAYRLMAHKRSASFERARQRAALSEWAEALLISVWTQQQAGAGAGLRDSEFGIWMHHKGAVMFEDTTDFRDIVDAIDTMDHQLLPRLREARDDRGRTDASIGAIKQLLDLIRYKLNDLFESSLGKDDGLDQETQLPDRRYLPAILRREMRAHLDSGRPFCLLLIEVHFPSLKEHQSSGTHQRLLQAAVEAVAECTRTTDHLFRYNEHRLLLLAVECDRRKAGDLAASVTEKLRNAVNTGNVQGRWTPVSPSVCIGIAEYDRHPDFQYFIQRVETALSEASMTQRSKIAVA
jgi:diguanylate cyclase